MVAFLGDTFVKSDGSTVDLAFVTRGKIVVVLYTAGGRLGPAAVDPFRECWPLSEFALHTQIGDPGVSPLRKP
jgi:hypothetical protein